MNILESIIAKEQFKVFVRCNTFNQSLYIKDALGGFIIQKTKFPFVCMVMDDCSTDGEQQVLLDWIDQECGEKTIFSSDIVDTQIIVAKHKINYNCTFAFYFLKRNTWKEPNIKAELYHPWRQVCPYEALCEGDDYWTDPYKLQKQVDVLENNPKCSIAISITQNVNPAGKPIGTYMPSATPDIVGEFTLEDFCKQQFKKGQWFGHTSSFLYRGTIRKKINAISEEAFKGFPYGDIVTILGCLLFGNGYLIPDVMTSYRIDSGGFNSSMKNNPTKAINVEKQLITGLESFDKYTDYKYHKYIHHRILWSQCIIEYWEGGKNGLVYIKPRYWKIAKTQGIKNSMLMALQTLLPHLYPAIKRVFKKS